MLPPKMPQRNYELFQFWLIRIIKSTLFNSVCYYELWFSTFFVVFLSCLWFSISRFDYMFSSLIKKKNTKFFILCIGLAQSTFSMKKKNMQTTLSFPKTLALKHSPSKRKSLSKAAQRSTENESENHRKYIGIREKNRYTPTIQTIAAT